MTDARKILVVLAVAAIALAGTALADEGKAICPFNGKDLSGWKLKGPESASCWTAGVAKVDSKDAGRLVAEPAEGKAGEMVNAIPAKKHSVDIYTKQNFADCTISLELMVPKGSNSGVYVMGEYEIQVLDSYGRKNPGPGDLGGLYGVKPPDVNPAKKPGEWQQMTIEFVAPKFENDKKVANGKLVKVTINGQTIHKDVELPRQTPGGVTGHEVAEGPLMFQGNHGPVAFRNIKITVPAKK